MDQVKFVEVFKKFEVKNITLNSLKVVSHKLYLVHP